jgi:hypothetical protein
MDHTLLAGGDPVARTADAAQAAVLAADRLPLIVVADVVAGTAAAGEGHLPGKAADVGVRIVDLRAGTAGAGRVQVPHAAPTAAVLVVVIVIIVVIRLVVLVGVALLAVAPRGALLHPIERVLGGSLLLAHHREGAEQRHSRQQATPGAGAGDCADQGIEGGRVHGDLLGMVAAPTRGQGQRVEGLSCVALRRTNSISVATSRHRLFMILLPTCVTAFRQLHE